MISIGFFVTKLNIARKSWKISIDLKLRTENYFQKREVLYVMIYQTIYDELIEIINSKYRTRNK